ncbi:MAG: hypothetical protein QOH61_1050 [Chloroflexota bacterium]|nr:hypothetical protein [Chloroflexota bacterium]
MEPTYFETPDELRAWFAEHSETDPELWVGFRRKASGLPTITWSEAVDEALCVGWIDGIRKGVDETGYMNRFTPRKRTSTWSAINVAKVADLTAAGRMTPAGLRAFEARLESKTGIYSYENPALAQALRREDLDRLRANAAAWAWWEAQSPSYRKQAAWWVNSARQDATRARRLETLISDCAAGRPIKPLSYGRARATK